MAVTGVAGTLWVIDLDRAVTGVLTMVGDRCVMDRKRDVCGVCAGVGGFEPEVICRL